MDFICKIVLDELTPAVWRRFQFHSEITFHQQHQLLQTVMEWDDYHSYEFVFEAAGGQTGYCRF
ncbi:hypothetical protein ACFQ88_08365 [Paenibacillus sp. NPDC056579]|uniref:IS1096 element passenger TnpR family protein n=1 Tax=Paenibacillus sp. NPDC056579 TaxID=3345871 RepID=UPI00369F68A0